MYKVMIIDDDIMIRDYLRSITDWNSLGLQLVCEAGDSETARDLYLLYHPDIIVTDISIPIINGIDLAKEFLKDDSLLQVIVITGLNDFEYIRSSVSLGAIDLLSKPVSAEELGNSLKKAIERLENMKKMQHTSYSLNTLLRDNLSILQERCISNLFEQRLDTDEEHLKNSLQLLNLDFPGKYLAAVMFKLNLQEDRDLNGTAFPTVFLDMLKNSLHENGFQAFCFFAQSNRLKCLVNWDGDKGEETLDNLLTKLLKESQFYFQAGFSVGIGTTVCSLTGIFDSAGQAAQCLKYTDNITPNLIRYSNIDHISGDQKTSSRTTVSSLTESIQAYRAEEFRELLDSYFSANNDIEEVREMSIRLLSSLSSLCYDEGIYPWNTINYPGTVASIFNAESSSKIKEILSELGISLMDVIFRKRSKSKNQLIQAAKKYIKDNISNPNLSLDTVSTHIGLSKVYFCQFFHKEEGVTFNNYLNMERISIAKRQLKTTNKRIFEISYDCGYSNPKYFNYVFKHITGKTPIDYREED